MSTTKIISVTFEIDVQKKAPQFSVPKEVCNILGVQGEDELALVVQDTAGTVLFDGSKLLKSGVEIYGADIRSAIKPGQRIRVEARLK
jgi:hypothetical protein